jgi:hypothetical protein
MEEEKMNGAALAISSDYGWLSSTSVSETAYKKKSTSEGARMELPGPEDALELLRQAKQRRLAGIPGIPAEEVIAAMERIRAKHVQINIG